MSRGKVIKMRRKMDKEQRMLQLVKESSARLDKLIPLDYDQETAARLIANWMLVETEMLNEGDE